MLVTLSVAVLGCGPSGLIAAHTAATLGCKVEIFSKKRKSELFGSQYLHEPIPGIISIDEGEPVKYVVLGTPEEYRRKTHGKFWDGIIAPEDFETDHMAWDIRLAYNRLWRKYSDLIVDFEIKNPEPEEDFPVDRAIAPFKNNRAYQYADSRIGFYAYDLVVSTVPRTIWIKQFEEFRYSTGWAAGDAPERGSFVDLPDEVSDNTIICDGTSRVEWTRLSKVFGHTTVEWPHSMEQPHPKAVRVVKPLEYKNNRVSNPANQDKFLHVGRYGEWKKGVVVTDAMSQVQKRITEMM